MLALLTSPAEEAVSDEEDEEDGDQKERPGPIRRLVAVTSEQLKMFRTCSNRLHFLSNRKPQESSSFLLL